MQKFWNLHSQWWNCKGFRTYWRDRWKQPIKHKSNNYLCSLKSEFAKSSRAELISYAECCVENIQQNQVNLTKLIENFDHIRINEEELHQESEDKSYPKDYLFYKELKELEEIHREKGKWISYEHLNKLKLMFGKYPDNYPSIWKVLKLSHSTYRRLLKELKRNDFNLYESKRQIRFQIQISEAEKKCIELWVAPPRSPITIKCI